MNDRNLMPEADDFNRLNISDESWGSSQNIPYFPHRKNNHFVGCEEILDKIVKYLRKEHTVMLHGIGGVGFVGQQCSSCSD
jgi:hypothetical protein